MKGRARARHQDRSAEIGGDEVDPLSTSDHRTRPSQQFGVSRTQRRGGRWTPCGSRSCTRAAESIPGAGTRLEATRVHGPGLSIEQAKSTGTRVWRLGNRTSRW